METSNATHYFCMFNICIRLTSLPEISIWDSDKVENLGAMFQDFTALTKVPNINSWNVKNVESFECML